MQAAMPYLFEEHMAMLSPAKQLVWLNHAAQQHSVSTGSTLLEILTGHLHSCMPMGQSF
jgi:hypothetical protein